jgi:hypothetical protein
MSSVIRRKLYAKREYFNFLIVNFPFIGSNIPAVPVYGINIVLICYVFFGSLINQEETDNWNA